MSAETGARSPSPPAPAPALAAPAVPRRDFEALRRLINGTVTVRGEQGWDEARTVWNGMIDASPAAVVRVARARDIPPVLDFAREHAGLDLAVRGGGHSVAGNGTADGGLVLDLGHLNSVTVDPERRTVLVGGGAVLRDVDRATAPWNLAVPLGVVSGTGVGGLTLGGGVGWLTRAHGLALDNLLSAEVVTADGATVHADTATEAGLFWGLRGGGGNFGVVSSFEFQAHPLPDAVLVGNLIYAASRIPEALDAWAAWTRELPDEMTSIASFLTPPADWELGSDPLMIVGFAWAGADDVRGTRLVDDLAGRVRPDAAETGAMPWAAWQSGMDDLFPVGARAYWKNTSFDRLDPEVTGVIAARAAEQTWQGTGFDIHHMGGAFARVPADATAFPARDARYWLNIYGFWPDAGDDTDRVGFVRGLAADMEPFATGGQYVNFLGREDLPGPAGPDLAAQRVYGAEKARRLAGLKRRWDPGNLFRRNHNIAPGPA